jgi:hypothetical protein
LHILALLRATSFYFTQSATRCATNHVRPSIGGQAVAIAFYSVQAAPFCVQCSVNHSILAIQRFNNFFALKSAMDRPFGFCIITGFTQINAHRQAKVLALYFR